MERIRKLSVPPSFDAAAMRRALEALAPLDRHRGYDWSPELDALLLEFWPTRPKEDVARIIGRSENVCRDRYRLLTGKETDFRKAAQSA